MIMTPITNPPISAELMLFPRCSFTNTLLVVEPGGADDSLLVVGAADVEMGVTVGGAAADVEMGVVTVSMVVEETVVSKQIGAIGESS